MGESTLTLRQFEVLKGIAEGDAPSQTALVAKTGIDRSTLADIVRRLNEQGLVSRRRTKEDARAYAVRLTAAGEAVVKEARPAAAATDAELLGALSAKERESFCAALAKIGIFSEHDN